MAIKWTGPINYVRGGIGNIVYPDESGIYVIAENTYKKIVRYVGQADKIRNRMQYHRSLNEQNIQLRNLMQNRIDRVEVFFTRIHDPTRKNNLEFTAFMKFRSEELYNTNMPMGNYISGINYPF